MKLPKTRRVEGCYISAKTLRRHFRTAVYESITQTHFLKPLSTISALANQTYHQDAIIARSTLLNSGSILLVPMCGAPSQIVSSKTLELYDFSINFNSYLHFSAYSTKHF
jgi:hypothetical protein